MKYTIIENTHAGRLAEAVNQHILDGWVPLGGVSVLPAGPEGGFSFYLQAMVTKDCETDETAKE